MSHSLSIAFFGTDEFAVYVLTRMKSLGVTPNLIITTPDRHKGRGLEMLPSEVKLWAMKEGIEVIYPEKIRNNIELEERLKNFDVSIVASYGKILPKEILNAPKAGTLNIHPSLLPELRGPTPIESAILNDVKEGENKKTGVSVMVLDEEMDHGPIITQETVFFSKWPDRVELSKILAVKGTDALVQHLTDWVEKRITPVEQNHILATYTKKIMKQDALIDTEEKDWQSDYRNFLKVQAYKEKPGAFAFFTKKNGSKVRVIITDALCDVSLKIQKVIPEGKKEMSFDDFSRGL